MNGHLIDFYRRMLLIRRFEEKAGQLYGMGLIGGFCHLCVGQEAVAVGVQSALSDRDFVISGYRAHGHMLAKGLDPKLLMAELTGRASGYCKGKGGSMHIFCREKGFFGGHGILASQTPLAAGLAFAQRYRQEAAPESSMTETSITVCYLGDGAADQGQFFEALNLAARFGLPVLFVIENNAADRQGDLTALKNRAEPFGIEGHLVDGRDVEAVAAMALEFTSSMRQRPAPILLEALTTRYRGHSLADPAKYRTRDDGQKPDVGKTRADDPIERMRAKLLGNELINEEGLKDLDREVRGICNDAAGFAQDTPEPDRKELLLDAFTGA